MTIQQRRFAIVVLILLCIAALVAASLFLPGIKPIQVEVIDVALGAFIGSLITATGFYFRS